MIKYTVSSLRCKNRFLSTRLYSSVSENKKICIIGSGPAGFYTAQHLLKNIKTEVDIYEKLPVPFGLIRYGVAPDHPEIKVVTNAFSKVAQHEKCHFFGNIDIGKDIKLSELFEAYHAVVLAFGASKDKELGIPGEHSSNVLSARKFVNWYNGHPDHVDDKVDLDIEVASVVGHGNVALDVARILLKSTDELKTTDISQHAFDALMKSRIKKVVLIGRRGPLQVAFTIKELREMIKLKNIATVMSIEDFVGVPEVLESLPRPRKRLVELLYNTAVKGTKNTDRTLEIKFFRSPKYIVHDEHGKVQKFVLGVNTVNGTSENASIIPTDKIEEVKCGLVFRSVGYQSIPIDPSIPFDRKKNIIPNINGRVLGQEELVANFGLPHDKVALTSSKQLTTYSTKTLYLGRAGLYCSGWVKTGPTGVILSTMNGSYETADKLIEDMSKERCFFKNCSGSKAILSILKHRGVKFTTFNDWLQMDKVELERGQAVGKSRQKIYNVREMLQIANTQ